MENKSGETKVELKEEWRNMEILNLSGYDISSHGRIRNSVSRDLLNNNPTIDGYIKASLISDVGTRRPFGVHRLVAHMFIPNPEKKSSVDHIDRNRSNNHLSNLRHATSSEQNSNKGKRICGGREIIQYKPNGEFVREWPKIRGDRSASKELKMDSKSIIKSCKTGSKTTCKSGIFLWKYKDLIEIPGERFLKVPIDDVEELWASSKGRIYRPSKIRIYNGGLNDKGYRVIHIRNKQNKLILRYVHRFVAAAFLGVSDLLVNHKNAIRSDNDISNLEYVTFAENLKHAVNLGNIKCTPLIRFNLDGSNPIEYKSVSDAVRDTGVSCRNIYTVCYGKEKSSGQFMWKFKQDVNINIITPPAKTIFILPKDNGINIITPPAKTIFILPIF